VQQRGPWRRNVEEVGVSRVAIIVLAAGRGSRFGGPSHKLAQSLGRATVLATTLRHAVASHLPVTVVTTEPLAETARRSVASRDVVVLADDGSAFGMGHSIAAGVAARPDADGWLILPGDMPLVKPQTLQAVARPLAEHPVCYAQYRGRRGHPVAFAAELYSELITLAGDEGARRLVARYPALAVEVDDPGVLVDIDTAEDLARVRAEHGEVFDSAPGALP
jgi:molybdenum cofactor cytidylyltransferase